MHFSFARVPSDVNKIPFLFIVDSIYSLYSSLYIVHININCNHEKCLGDDRKRNMELSECLASSLISSSHECVSLLFHVGS